MIYRNILPHGVDDVGLVEVEGVRGEGAHSVEEERHQTAQAYITPLKLGVRNKKA